MRKKQTIKPNTKYKGRSKTSLIIQVLKTRLLNQSLPLVLVMKQLYYNRWTLSTSIVPFLTSNAMQQYQNVSEWQRLEILAKV